jgi:hypothetical protein
LEREFEKPNDQLRVLYKEFIEIVDTVFTVKVGIYIKIFILRDWKKILY